MIDICKQIQTDKEEKTYYRKHQEIFYCGIVGRLYSLWETFCKRILYKYYLHYKKSGSIDHDTLVKNLSLNALPGYVYEKGRVVDEKLEYSITEELITATTKNMDIDALNELLKRVNLQMGDSDFSCSKKYIESMEGATWFEVMATDSAKVKVEKVLKKIINYRNRLAHSFDVEDFQDLEVVSNWVLIIIELSRDLLFYLIFNTCKIAETTSIQIGTIQQFLPRIQVLLIDLTDKCDVEKNDYILIYKEEQLMSLYKAASFQVNDKDVIKLSGGEKAGIQLLFIGGHQGRINTSCFVKKCV